MRARWPIKLGVSVLLLACALPSWAAQAAGVVASVRGAVSVQRGSGPARNAELGMRLDGGDVVRVGEAGSAAVYLTGGGGIVRLSPGEKLTMPQPGAAPASASRAVPLAPSAMRVSESGLWTLNDPEGSILVAAMRGDDAGSKVATALSPRHETIVGGELVFYAAGGTRPAKIAIASGDEVVWRGGSFAGEGPWSPEGLPALKPGALYSWRLESAGDGSSLSEWTPFRVAGADDRRKAEAFEREVTVLSSSDDGKTAADLFRCGHYLEVQSWTPLLAAASRLLRASPDSRFGRAAREQAIHGLGLDADAATVLERRLSGGGS